MGKQQYYATKKLKEVRESKGFTQQEMAEILTIRFGEDISPSTYQKIEQGIYSVKIEKAVAIARELELKITELWEAR